MSSPRPDNTTNRNNMRTGRTTPVGVSERANLSRASITTRNECASSKPFTTDCESLIKAPLSSLSREYPSDYNDLESFAKRSVEERQRKAKEEGKVLRPLNSYMLYRKAYQQVARRVLSNDQQQLASKIVAISWNKYEPKEIKDRFKSLARIDNQMHRKAFPTYKYTPNQAKKPKSGALDSKKLSTSIERRVCRRFSNKEAYSHGTPGKKLIRPSHVEALGQHQSGEGNMNIKWWAQGPLSFANPLMYQGGHHDRYEQPFAADSRYFESQYPDVLDDASFTQLPTQQVPLAANTHECLTGDECIAPLFLQSFENMSTSQNPGGYLNWQSQETQAVHDFSPISPDMNVGQAADHAYEGQEEWAVQHIDERQNAFGWHPSSEQRSR